MRLEHCRPAREDHHQRRRACRHCDAHLLARVKTREAQLPLCLRRELAEECEMNYSVGFVFSMDKSRVLLIKKNKPEWQAGLLNGVGGKAEPQDRRARETMRRECMEEA